MLAYRITLKQYSKILFAPGISGRWNGSGRKIIYCAESIPLAFLENMVRRQGVGFNDNFKTMILEIPDNFEVQEILPKDLPSGWRRFTDYSKCQPIGNKWYDEGLALVLKVPSAVLPEAFNYVVNATHPGFKNIKLLQVTDLIPDERIEDLLKKYRKL
ncbi:MAG: RES family NAD+ phosphorylase [Aquabacterium sp.]|nr:RES family NAD+ phosphorylase [Ferruginibacter sp.]